MVEADRSGPVLLTRRMLWNGAAGEPPRRLPVLVLLGPVGAGKSHSLSRISEDLGWGVVHARFDFAGDDPSPIDVLVRLAYDFSRKWRHRKQARFLRFTVALIAIGAELTTTDRQADRQQLLRLLDEFKRGRWPGRLDPLVNVVVKTATATRLVPAPLGEAFAAEFPKLIQTILPRLGQALRSIADVELFQGGDSLDALVDLNWMAHGRTPDPRGVTTWLTEAFLADVRENHRRMSGPERRSPCDCDNPGKQAHLHNWVVLLDDVDHPGGLAFLQALTTARENYHGRHGERGTGDPLLVVATSGKWQGEWASELGRTWRPPWQPAGPAARIVPDCRDASYTHWIDQPPNTRSTAYYPVLLEPLAIGEVATILGRDVPAAQVAFAHQATGGLPGAAQHLARALRRGGVRPGARDVLGTEGPDPWRTWLSELRLSTVDIDELVTAAPFATAPWLVPLPADGLVDQPHVGPILTELRASLWVNAARDGGTPDVTLHPWLEGNLVSALARRNGGGPSYTAQFTALRAAAGGDDVRLAYCLLALGDFPAVVDLFERDFPHQPHRKWLDRLAVVARAPDDQPLDEGYEDLYARLVDADVEHRPGDRTEIRNNLARLLATSWLATNPFAVRGTHQNRDIAKALGALSAASRRSDTSALDDAAELAHRGLWP